MSGILFYRNTIGDLGVISSKKLSGDIANTMIQRIYGALLEINIPMLNYITADEAISLIRSKIYNISELTEIYSIEDLNNLIVIDFIKDEYNRIMKISIDINISDFNISNKILIDAKDGMIPIYSEKIQYPVINRQQVVIQRHLNNGDKYIKLDYNVNLPVYILSMDQIDDYNINTNYESEDIASNSVQINYLNLVLDLYTASSVDVIDMLNNNGIYENDNLSIIPYAINIYDKNMNVLNPAYYTFNNNIINFTTLDVAPFFPLTIKIPYTTTYAIGVLAIKNINENMPYRMDCVESTLIELNKEVEENDYLIIHFREYPV